MILRTGKGGTGLKWRLVRDFSSAFGPSGIVPYVIKVQTHAFVLFCMRLHLLFFRLPSDNLAYPFSTSDVKIAEQEYEYAINCISGPAESHVHLQIQYDVRDVCRVDQQAAQLQS